MSVGKVIRATINERGMSLAELCRRTNLNPELIRRSLENKRHLKSEEFLVICQVLDLSLSDFVHVKPEE